MDGETPDRIPVAPMVNVPHASMVLGVKPWEYVTDNILSVRGPLAARKKYDYDWIFNHQPIQGITAEEKKALRVENDFVTLPTEMGSVLKIPLDGGPAVIDPALKDYAELDSLEIPDVDAPGRMEPLQRLLESTKDEVYICSKVPAPFHYAAEWMRGLNQFLLDMMVNPEYAHRLLDFMADVAIEIGKKQIELGTHGIMMEDPSAAAQVISPNHYREFAYPYERKVTKELKKHGGEIIIHICGDTTPILEDLAATGAKCLSVDESVDLGRARAKLGDRVALFGNVPVETLYSGSKTDIESSARKCMDSAGDYGYILSSSCGLHAKTPFENLHTLVDYAIRYKKNNGIYYP